MPNPQINMPQEDIELASTLRPEQIERLSKKPGRKEKPESQEQRDHRLAVVEVVSDPMISPRVGLEALEAIDVTFEETEEPREQMARICADYGLDPGEISPEALQKLTLLASGVGRMRSEAARQEAVVAVERELHEQMTNIVFQKIDGLNALLAKPENKPEDVEATLVAVLDAMGKLSQRLDATDERDSGYWNRIMERFNTLVEAKTKAGREVSQIFSRVMANYGDFIEDEIVSRKLKELAARGGTASMEHLVQEIYGHTPEEMEKIKERNRGEVVDAMQGMAEEPYVTTDMLLRLYRTNNRGIAPKVMSRLRDKPGEFVGFGRRFGIMPEDVAEEMKDWDGRVAKMMDRALVENWSDARYELAVAQLHNELLEIHPFPDRNGSTSVMFMEMMMMRRGYEPPKKREKSYYKNITKILGYNPAAVGLIRYEMERQASGGTRVFRRKEAFGYFAGRTTKGKEKLYEILFRLAHKEDFKGQLETANPFEF